MYKDEISQYVEAIKLAAGSVQYKNLSVRDTFIEAIHQLYQYYEYTSDNNYLETAIFHIQAYLEMGFSYEWGKNEFDIVLSKMGTTRELKFPRKFYVEKKIKLNKQQVRSMIKRWPASPHQKMKIGEVVSDIISKVKSQRNGIFYYKCEVTEDIYELVISEKETFFHDLRRGIFYTFIV